MPAQRSAKCAECGTENENGAVYCKNCGQKLAASQRTCRVCGAVVPQYAVAMCPECKAILNPVTIQTETKSAESAPASHMKYDTGGTRYAVPAQYSMTENAQNDANVFGRLRLFGILGITEAVLSFFVLLSGNLMMLFAAGSAGIHAAGRALLIDVTFMIVELAIVVYSIFIIRSVFRILSQTDIRFHTPASLVTVLIIGLVIIFPAIIIIIAAGSTVSTIALSTGLLLAIGFMTIIALILLLLGIIGLLIGLWRIGTKYNDSMYKIAALFYLIPFLGIVSSILIYATSSSALKHERNRQRQPET